jgi:hypothetical protein
MRTTLRKGTVTYSYYDTFYEGAVQIPEIRLRGKWLESIGFKIGGKITIEISESTLIIQVDNITK